MQHEGLHIGVDRVSYRRKVAIYIGFFRGGDIKAHAKPIQFEELSPEEIGVMPEKPVAELRIEEAQQLADELWNAGIRPTQAKQSHGAFEAVGAHLNDMRAIVADKLGVKLTGIEK